MRFLMIQKNLQGTFEVFGGLGAWFSLVKGTPVCYTSSVSSARRRSSVLMSANSPQTHRRQNSRAFARCCLQHDFYTASALAVDVPGIPPEPERFYCMSALKLHRLTCCCRPAPGSHKRIAKKALVSGTHESFADAAIKTGFFAAPVIIDSNTQALQKLSVLWVPATISIILGVFELSRVGGQKKRTSRRPGFFFLRVGPCPTRRHRVRPVGEHVGSREPAKKKAAGERAAGHRPQGHKAGASFREERRPRKRNGIWSGFRKSGAGFPVPEPGKRNRNRDTDQRKPAGRTKRNRNGGGDRGHRRAIRSGGTVFRPAL